MLKTISSNRFLLRQFVLALICLVFLMVITALFGLGEKNLETENYLLYIVIFIIFSPVLFLPFTILINLLEKFKNLSA